MSSSGRALSVFGTLSATQRVCVCLCVIRFGVQFQVRDIKVIWSEIKSPIETTLERVTCKLLHLCINSYK